MKIRFSLARVLTTLLLAGGIATLAACNGSGGSSGTGSMSLGITDTPVDAAQTVMVAFTGVTLQGPDGTKTITFPQEKTIDLLSLQGNASADLLDSTSVAAGQYQWIRLNLDLANSYIVTDTGAKYPLTIPSGSRTGLKLVSGFMVAQGGQADFMIDFDLRKSLTLARNGSTGAVKYILKPALKKFTLILNRDKERFRLSAASPPVVRKLHTFRQYYVGCFQGNTTFNDILKFSDIAGKIIIHKHLEPVG